jgi:preprotein translocase subunit SecA
MIMPSPPRLAKDWLRSVWSPSSHSSVIDPARLAGVREGAAALRDHSDEQLTAAAQSFSAKMRSSPTPCSASLMIEAFAFAFEGVRRVLGMELYNEQLISGMLLCRGMIAEMATGEGKTLCAALPAVFHALRGQSVHVATPNIYLAERDCELLTPVYRMLDCSVGLLKEGAPEEEKRAVYKCDIVYGTGYEFGFDYLREQLAGISRARGMLGSQYRDILRGSAAPESGYHARHGVAIIDEIDSVMIDEACIPLIISDGGSPGDNDSDVAPYVEAVRIAERLCEDSDYLIDREAHTVSLTKSGRGRAHTEMGVQSQMGLQRSWSVYIEQALQALLLLTKDVDYVTDEGKIVLVDGATGRLCPDRNWSEGLHQILEVKENLSHTGELRTAARITRQRYFRMYDVLCGMTGTAMESRWEFWRTYGLHVARVPLRRPLRRQELPPRYFVDAASKWQAAVDDIKRMHATGRPVLIGSRTIENNEVLAKQLDEVGIPYQLLNGKQTADEADVVSRAGHRGAVTIATNMAGRGTDIKLEPGVAEMGGLHLLAVEPNESLRVDRQLIGRVGRQGDPGSYQFFVSADDALLLRFGQSLSRRMKSMPQMNGEICHDLSRKVRTVQKRSEAAGAKQRKQLTAADHWRTNDLVNLVK